jgi:hypothetical protein
MDGTTQPDLRQIICDAVKHVMANPGLPTDQRLDSRSDTTRQPSISEPDSGLTERTGPSHGTGAACRGPEHARAL